MKIALSGKAKTGKDTLASFLNDKNQFYCTAFADKVKEILLDVYPNVKRDEMFGDSDLRERKIPNMSTTNRQLLIEISKKFKEYDPMIWINYVNNYIAKYDNIIIKDLRFKNEYDFLRQNGFFLVRIKRTTDKIILDQSEFEQDELTDEMFDFVVENNKDTTYLYEQSQLILRGYESRQKLFSTTAEASGGSKVL